jgi:putative DNA primase/helicase
MSGRDALLATIDAELEQQPHAGEGPISDDDLAKEFTARYAASARYLAAWGRWLLWNGQRWETDERLRAFSMAREICRDALDRRLAESPSEGQGDRLRQRFGSAQTIAAVLKIASSDPRHAITVDDLDADPWALNTPSGILDLKTGAIRPHDPNALCTKITAAAPTTDCPIFLRTLERVIPDAEVRAYLQRLAGYALVGTVRDHVLPFWYGSGRNGKSVIANALRLAMGDYATVLPAEVLVESRNDRHPTEIAVLRGVRLAVASEVDSGRRWNESRLKRLTGGDPISARFIGRDPFEFTPSHKLLVIANAKPGLRVIDDAIRGRIHLCRFGVTIPAEERDAALPERLTAEAGGILGWAMVGCLEWLSGGLAPPEAVLEATGEYLDAEDGIAQWVGECCRPAGQITLSAAHRSYREWCDRNDMPPLGRNTFGDQLEARGYRRTEQRCRVFVFNGLSLPINEAARYADN